MSLKRSDNRSSNCCKSWDNVRRNPAGQAHRRRVDTNVDDFDLHRQTWITIQNRAVSILPKTARREVCRKIRDRGAVTLLRRFTEDHSRQTITRSDLRWGAFRQDVVAAGWLYLSRRHVPQFATPVTDREKSGRIIRCDRFRNSGGDLSTRPTDDRHHRSKTIETKL